MRHGHYQRKYILISGSIMQDLGFYLLIITNTIQWSWKENGESGWRIIWCYIKTVAWMDFINCCQST